MSALIKTTANENILERCCLVLHAREVRLYRSHDAPVPTSQRTLRREHISFVRDDNIPRGTVKAHALT